MIRGVLFDCDGTLVDSHDAVIGFFARVFRMLDLPAPDLDDPELARFCMSNTNDEVLGRLLSEPVHRRLAREFMASLSSDDLLDGLSWEPGAQETLLGLRPGHLLGICTNRDADMTPVARHFGLDEMVDVILTAEDVEKPKPDPEMLLKATAELGLAAGSVAYVGDTAVDAQAAEAAGIAFICYDRLGRGHCRDASPAVTISDLRTLPRHLQALGARRRPNVSPRPQ